MAQITQDLDIRCKICQDNSYRVAVSMTFRESLNISLPISTLEANGLFATKQITYTSRKNRAQKVESKILISNRENIDVYVVNLDVFSIGNRRFAFNELSPSR